MTSPAPPYDNGKAPGTFIHQITAKTRPRPIKKLNEGTGIVAFFSMFFEIRYLSAKSVRSAKKGIDLGLLLGSKIVPCPPRNSHI